MPPTKNLRPTEAPHIYLDDQGRAWIDDTAYRVSMVVLDYRGPDGFTPEQIVEEHYHALTLGQVHAAVHRPLHVAVVAKPTIGGISGKHARMRPSI